MQQSTPNISVIGAGLAGLSLVHYLAATPHMAKTRLLGPISQAAEKPHIWGFWQTRWLDEAAYLSRKSWSCWQIITPQAKTTQKADKHPYHALESHVWLGHCLKTMRGSNIQHDPRPVSEISPQGDLYFDSRPPQLDKTVMLQHFHGIEIESKEPVFTPEVMTLMDFRCDQSQGIHFIYLLPFSPTNALVESTLFSFSLVPESYYQEAINSYLSSYYKLHAFRILSQESCAIPMGFFPVRDKNLLAIGANGGCVRPSSGYAFSFIQKQSRDIAAMLAAGKLLNSQHHLPAPHRWLDRQLDRIFLDVLARHPKQAPDLFLQLGKYLSGDELAMFMSGQASLSVYARLIAAMPKDIFIASALRILARKA